MWPSAAGSAPAKGWPTKFRRERGGDVWELVMELDTIMMMVESTGGGDGGDGGVEG